MPYERVGEVIDRVRRLHRQFQRRYAASSKWQQNEQLTHLLRRMARQEQAMAASLASFEAEVQTLVKETWLQYVPLETVGRVLDDAELSQDADIETVVAHATALDAAITDAYRVLASSQVPPRVQEVFASLVEMEGNKGKQRSLDAGELFDAERLDAADAEAEEGEADEGEGDHGSAGR